MKTYLPARLIVLLLPLSVFMSCQREIDDVIAPEFNDSTDITALIILDTTFQTGQDTVQKFTFMYDSDKRRVLETITDYQPGIAGPGRITYTRYLRYEFSGSGELPYKMTDEGVSGSGAQAFDGEHFYFYQSGQLIKDSISFRTADGAYRVDEYKPISSSRYLLPGRWGDNTGVFSADTSYAAVVWLDSNLLSQKDTLILAGGSGLQAIPHAFTYDSRPNPLLKVLLPIYTPCPTSVVQKGAGEFIFPTRNNIRSWNYDGSISNRSYEYGDNGLPAVVRESEGTTALKWIFTYTNL